MRCPITFVLWFCLCAAVYSSNLSSATQSSKKTFVKHYHFPNKNISFSELSYNETHMAYGLCSDEDYEKRHCQLTVESLNSHDTLLSCNVTIKISNKDVRNVGYDRIVLLNNNRAVLLSWEGPPGGESLSILKLINVNLNDCTATEIGFDTDLKRLLDGSLVSYEAGYDLFYTNFKLCKSDYCRVTFDNEGNVVKDTVTWGKHQAAYLGVMRTVARQSPVNGFVSRSIILRGEPYNPRAFFVSNDGEKMITTEPIKFEGDLAVSTNDNSIGTCLSNWIKVPPLTRVLYTLECKKFDFEGKLVKTELQVNSSSLVGDDKIIRFIDRLNLSDGFLLFATLCPNNYGGDCSPKESYFVYRLNGNGETLKTIEINDFKCDHKFMEPPRAYENAVGQKCVSLVCKKFDLPQDKLTIGTRCFDDSEL